MEFPEKDFPEEKITSKNEGKFILLRRDVQTLLMKEKLFEEGISEDDSEEKNKFYMVWAEKYSKRFGDIFHQQIIANPHFAEDLKTIPEAKVDLIRKMLYEDKNKVDPDDYEEQIAA